MSRGGHKVPVNDFADHTPYIGLDWFILDLLGSSLIFIFVEKLFPLRRQQPVFRAEWQTDFHHFIVNHMVLGFVLLATNLAVHKLFGWGMDWLAGSRQHILELLLTRTLVLAPVYVLGFSKEVIDAYITCPMDSSPRWPSRSAGRAERKRREIDKE